MNQIVRSNCPELPVRVPSLPVTDENVVPTVSQQPIGRPPMRSTLLRQANVGTRPPQDDTFE